MVSKPEVFLRRYVDNNMFPDDNENGLRSTDHKFTEKQFTNFYTISRVHSEVEVLKSHNF